MIENSRSVIGDHVLIGICSIIEGSGGRWAEPSSRSRRPEPDYVDDAVNDYSRSRYSDRYPHGQTGPYARHSARKRSTSSDSDSGRASRRRRHVGAHDAEGLQRIISTGTYCIRILCIHLVDQITFYNTVRVLTVF